jgi:hypothetical protein
VPGYCGFLGKRGLFLLCYAAAHPDPVETYGGAIDDRELLRDRGEDVARSHAASRHRDLCPREGLFSEGRHPSFPGIGKFKENGRWRMLLLDGIAIVALIVAAVDQFTAPRIR